MKRNTLVIDKILSSSYIVLVLIYEENFSNYNNFESLLKLLLIFNPLQGTEDESPQQELKDARIANPVT